jgi:5-methylcytosine-specific restriction protein B
MLMPDDLQIIQETWDAFLKEWPLDRLRRMRLDEYSAAGQSHTFTSWIESRLDQMGSIWGGSSFKFGIFSRKDKSPKASGPSDSYSEDYAWYTKYGRNPKEAFERVRLLVVQTAEAAQRGDFSAIDAIDLGTSYKWKIAFQYQDARNPGVIAAFKRKRLQSWLKGRVGTIPDESVQRQLELRGDDN